MNSMICQNSSFLPKKRIRKIIDNGHSFRNVILYQIFILLINIFNLLLVLALLFALLMRIVKMRNDVICKRIKKSAYKFTRDNLILFFQNILVQ